MSKILVEVLTKEHGYQGWITDDGGYSYGVNASGLYINDAYFNCPFAGVSKRKTDVTYAPGYWLRYDVCDWEESYGKEPT